MAPRFVLSATVLDARDPHGLAAFYQRLLGWESGGGGDPTWVMLRAPSGTGLSFRLDPLHVAPT